MGTGGMGHMGNGNTWGSRVQGMAYSGYPATWAIGHMGQKGTGGMGYRGMGSRGIWGNRVQGYGVQDTWAIGTLSVGHMGQ